MFWQTTSLALCCRRSLYLLLPGLHEEYERAAAWVRTSMPLNASFDASVFETIIRVVGGMLAAHDLTGDPVMLQRWVGWGGWVGGRGEAATVLMAAGAGVGCWLPTLNLFPALTACPAALLLLLRAHLPALACAGRSRWPTACCPPTTPPPASPTTLSTWPPRQPRTPPGTSGELCPWARWKSCLHGSRLLLCVGMLCRVAATHLSRLLGPCSAAHSAHPAHPSHV